MATEPSIEGTPPANLAASYSEPLNEFRARDGAVLFLLFVVLYKFGDAFAARMMTTFFIRGLDFTQTEIGTVFKLGGFFSTLVGIFLGGIILAKSKSFFKVLMFFGLLQAFSRPCIQ